MSIPKKKKEKSRTRTQRSQYKRNQRKKLMNGINSLKRAAKKAEEYLFAKKPKATDEVVVEETTTPVEIESPANKKFASKENPGSKQADDKKAPKKAIAPKKVPAKKKAAPKKKPSANK